MVFPDDVPVNKDFPTGSSSNLLVEPDYTAEVAGTPEDRWYIILSIARNGRIERQIYEFDVFVN